MKSLTLTEIKNAFIPADQEQWTDPCLADVPWSDLDFLFWNHVNPGYFYMVVPDGEELIGMIVKMNKDGGNRSGSCDFCFATNRSVGVRPAFIETYDNHQRVLTVGRPGRHLVVRWGDIKMLFFNTWLCL